MQAMKHKKTASTYQVFDQHLKTPGTRDSFPVPKAKSKEQLNSLVKKSEILMPKQVKILKGGHKRIKSAGTALMGHTIPKSFKGHKRTNTHSNIDHEPKMSN